MATQPPAWYPVAEVPAPPEPPAGFNDVAPWSPPPQQSSGGGSEGWFPVGYGGTSPKGGGGGWSSGGGGQGYGFPPGSPGYQAAAGAYQQSQQAAQDALNRLAPGQFLGGGYGGALGNIAMDRYKNTPGFDPAAMAAQRQMLSEQSAGSLANNLRTINERAQASGFGNSMGLIDAESRARASSAQNLSNAQNQLEWMNQQARMQREGTQAALLGGLANAESGYGTAYALAQMNRQFPVIPGITPGPGGQGGYGGYGGSSGPAWSQTGQYMPGGYGYDPFTPQKTGSGAPTGYNPQQPWSPW